MHEVWKLSIEFMFENGFTSLEILSSFIYVMSFTARLILVFLWDLLNLNFNLFSFIQINSQFIYLNVISTRIIKIAN